MTKEECLRMMRLLSALECAGLMREPRLPDYIYEQIADMVGVLEREILGSGAPGLERFFGKVGAQRDQLLAALKVAKEFIPLDSPVWFSADAAIRAAEEF